MTNEAEALTLARKIAMFNSEAIYFVKNSLLKITSSIQKNLDETREKFVIIIKSNYPHVNPDIILANTTNNNNHDLTKIEVELIKEILLEDNDEFSN